MKKIFLISLFILIIATTVKTAGAITYSELNRYVFASYTPANFSGKILYIFEDPLCPYCHKLNEHIVKYSRESGYKINLIFKIVHGERAFNYAVSFVCGHRIIKNANFKKYIDLDYRGNYCSYGKDLVSYDEEISNILGVTKTPSLISNRGFRESGLSLSAIKRGMGIIK